MQIDIRDVEFQAFSSSGPGGQHKNAHANCVRAIHRPTGIVVRATKERSLGQNKKMALYALNEKLNELVDDKAARAKKERRDAKPEASFGGAHVRSYRLVDGESVTDHRTGQSLPARRVLAGDLDPLLLALLRQRIG